MNQRAQEIPAEAGELARCGRIVEAIKIIRAQTGLGLAEAKEAVDAYLRDPRAMSPSGGSSASPSAFQLPPLAIVSLENGHLIEAIKQTRKTTGLGLKDAKEAVERFLEQNPAVNAAFKSATSNEFNRVAAKLILVLSLVGLAVLGYHYFFS